MQILTDISICVLRSLYKACTLKTPDRDLTDIFCVTYSYYVHNINIYIFIYIKDIERENYT